MHPIVKYLADHPACAEALCSYRTAARVYLRDSADRRTRGRKRVKDTDLDHWTVILGNDFYCAGPRYASEGGFDRRDWPELQVLRNAGPTFVDGFADAIDAVLDEVARG